MEDKLREENYWLDRGINAVHNLSQEILNHPHRKLVLDALGKFYPFDSLLEVGCGCGANLKNISMMFPKVHLAGIDINKYVIFKGREYLPEVNFIVAPSYKIPFNTKTFDIILTDAVLMYLPINKVKPTIEEFLRIAKKGVILIEPEGESKIGELNNGYWCRDYQSLLEDYKLKVEKQKITKEIWPSPIWEERGFVFTAHLPCEILSKN